jgi:hypothetical protein
MFKKIKDILWKAKIKNQSIDKIEKDMKTEKYLVLFYLFAFIFSSFFAMIVTLVEDNHILGFIVLSIFFGIYLNILIVMYFYKKLYVFLRKVNWMEDREP